MKMLLPLLVVGFMVWIIAAIVAIFLSGCLMGPELGKFTYLNHTALKAPVAIREIPIWVDKDFAPVDRASITDAVNTWNYALNGYLRLTIVDREFDMEVSKIVTQVNQGGWLFLKIKSDSPLVPPAKQGYRILGFCEMVGGQHLWLVTDRLMNEDVFGITLHEIGHLLGSRHIAEEHLMFPYYTRARYQCIDKDSLSNVAKHYGLSVERLNYCVDGLDVVEPEKKADHMTQEPGCGT